MAKEQLLKILVPIEWNLSFSTTTNNDNEFDSFIGTGKDFLKSNLQNKRFFAKIDSIMYSKNTTFNLTVIERFSLESSVNHSMHVSKYSTAMMRSIYFP